jgi:ElaB/YqjD/DUF883 family membrane-anchored ribosome-binding protein
VANETNMGFQTNESVGDSLAEGTQKIKDTLSDAANRAQHKGKELGRAAIEKIEQGRQTAAGSLQSAATTLHQTADDLPGVQTARSMTHTVASRLESVAGYLRDHDTKRMMTDVERAVKNHPGQSMLIAIGVGFLVGRAFRSSD